MTRWLVVAHGKFGACFADGGHKPSDKQPKQSNADSRSSNEIKGCERAKAMECVCVLQSQAIASSDYYTLIHCDSDSGSSCSSLSRAAASLQHLFFLLHFAMPWSALSLCLRPCFVTMLIHWIYHHKWNKHTHTIHSHFFRHKPAHAQIHKQRVCFLHAPEKYLP